MFDKYGGKVEKKDKDKRGQFYDHDDAIWAMEKLQSTLSGKEMMIELDKTADKKVLRSILKEEGTTSDEGTQSAVGIFINFGTLQYI